MPTLTRRHCLPNEPTRLRISGDVLTAEALHPVARLLDKPGRHRLHLDLGGVRIPTAGGLGALLTLNKGLRGQGGELALLNLHPWAYEVFALTRLTDILDVRAR